MSTNPPQIRLGQLISSSLPSLSSSEQQKKPTQKTTELNNKRQIILTIELDDNGKKKKREEEKFLFNRINNLVEEEVKISRINKIKLLNDWRIIMRIAKIDEIRKDLTLYMKNFNRELDNKDAILQMIDADIDEAEEQYQIALNNHFIHLQELISLQDSRIKGLFKEFDKDVNEIESEFKVEFSQIKENFEEEQSEINKMLRFIHKERELKEGKQKENFRQMKENLLSSIKEKNTKTQEKIQKMTDNEISIFNSEMNDIKAKTKEKSQLDKNYINELNRLEREISSLKMKVDKLNDTNKQLKTKIKQNQEDWELKNKNLKDEKEKLMYSYKKLKEKMEGFRNNQKDKLKNLVNNSFNCNAKLKEYIDLSEKILRLSEICRRFETEKEKILPYYQESNVINDEIILPSPENLVGIENCVYEEIEALSQFWKRFNKVFLDVVSLKKQKEEISQQNELLKSMLQQYYDGFTVNNTVLLSKDNPLLIIENRQYVYKSLIDDEDFNKNNYQEGKNIDDDFKKQKGFSIIK